MNEIDYIVVSNLAKSRMAEKILKDMLAVGDPALKKAIRNLLIDTMALVRMCADRVEIRESDDVQTQGQGRQVIR